MSELQCPLGKAYCTSDLMPDTPCAWRVDGICVVVVIADKLAYIVASIETLVPKKQGK